MARLFFGNTPVPNTAGWSEEEHFFLAECHYFKRVAICQRSAQGEGKPQFGKPHAERQRQAVAQCLCDLCGKPLRLATKVSLSHARPVPHGAEGWAILQVEPMLHRQCAAQCIELCPSLRRDVQAGSLMIRTVTRWRAQCALMSAEYVATLTGVCRVALGHAKIELLQWTDRDLDWLTRERAAA
jgi:hypothetical protein